MANGKSQPVFLVETEYIGTHTRLPLRDHVDYLLYFHSLDQHVVLTRDRAYTVKVECYLTMTQKERW